MHTIKCYVYTSNVHTSHVTWFLYFLIGHFSTTKLILIILSPALFVIFVVIIIISCVICCICYSKRRTRRSYYRVRSLQVTAATVTVAKVTTATVTAAIVTKQTKPATYSTVPPTEYQSVSPPPTTQ